LIFRSQAAFDGGGWPFRLRTRAPDFRRKAEKGDPRRANIASADQPGKSAHKAIAGYGSVFWREWGEWGEWGKELRQKCRSHGEKYCPPQKRKEKPAQNTPSR
jgi:hypothetical protein